MRLFLAIVGLHFAEHLAQMIEVYALGYPRSESLGLIGLIFPYLVRSEWLHYAFAWYTLYGLMKYRFSTTAIYLQTFHFIEHVILLSQYLLAFTPTGIGGIWFLRIELHFFYNLIVIGAMFLKRRGVFI